jgi:hypothetical protein
MEVNHLFVGVEDGESGTPVAVARLADRPWVDQISRRRFQVQRNGFGLADGSIFGTKSIGRGAVGKESALQVRVTEKCQRRGQSDQRGQRVAERDHVFVFVVRRAMDQLHIGEVRNRDRSLRQVMQPGEIVGSQFVTRPQRSGRGHGIEIAEVDQSGGGFVVVATHEALSQIAGTVGDFVGARAVPYNVAQVHRYIERRSGGKTSFESFKIGVNVAQNQYAQEHPGQTLDYRLRPGNKMFWNEVVRPGGQTVAEARRAGWRFKDKTPLWFTALVALIAVDSAAHFLPLWTVPHWAKAKPDAIHTYRLPFHDGVIYFVQPLVGQYLNAWWIDVGMLVILVVLLFANRNKLERGT